MVFQVLSGSLFPEASVFFVLPSRPALGHTHLGIQLPGFLSQLLLPHYLLLFLASFILLFCFLRENQERGSLRLSQAGKGGADTEHEVWVAVGPTSPRWPPSGGALPAPNNERKGLAPTLPTSSVKRPVASFHGCFPRPQELEKIQGSSDSLN